MNEGRFYWDCRPGFFLNQETGEKFLRELGFGGNAQEWYQTLYETILDADIKLMNHQGVAILCSVDAGTILQCLVQFRPSMDGPSIPGKHTIHQGRLGRYEVYFTSNIDRNIIKLVTISTDDYAEIEIKGMGL